ncbi:MAG: bifunctional phosphoribosylaminoimidazolecarboxamide formyltransferase/IMP cyclohydrolase [bacterium]
MNKYALVSVSDKNNIVDFCKRLNLLDYTILATGKTAKILAENNVNCVEVSDYTGFPEIFDGRVKTLQPKIFGGILIRPDKKEDIKQAIENNINQIEIVCVNLYPFPQVAARADIDLDTKVENIDIGGPSLIRAAAKNYKYVSVLTSPEQYDDFVTLLEEGKLDIEARQKLAVAAFAHTAYYDTVISNYFEKEFNVKKLDIRLNYKLYEQLRYGENPHQKAYYYGNFDNYFDFLHGKELSYNNIVDLNAAVELISDMEETSCVIIKHTNPCGAAIGNTVYEAYTRALTTDPVSSFGGIVAFNAKVDLDTAKKLNEIFLEIICAPDYDVDALEELRKKKNRRIIKIKNIEKADIQIKSVLGGLLVQESDKSIFPKDTIKLVTKKECSPTEYEDLKLAWVICKHVKSNTIIYVKDKKVVGVGAGQMSRVDSAKIAGIKAKEQNHSLIGAVAASDAFFPFADGLEEIIKNGITTVIQPGGSVRDNEVIAAADNSNIAMYFTGVRNFKH